MCNTATREFHNVLQDRPSCCRTTDPPSQPSPPTFNCQPNQHRPQHGNQHHAASRRQHRVCLHPVHGNLQRRRSRKASQHWEHSILH